MPDILKQEYDFIFSLGEACLCASALQNLNLRQASYPLDWLYGGDIETRTQLLISNFKDFINKEDLELVGKRENPIPCDIYRNKQNNIVFNHDFPLNGSIDNDYYSIKEKYDRRINRLYSKIASANKILAVYIESPATKSKPKKIKPLIKQCYKTIQEKFPDKEFYLLYLNNAVKFYKIFPFLISKTKLDKNVLYVRTYYRNRDKNTEAYIPQPEILANIMKNIKLVNKEI